MTFGLATYGYQFDQATRVWIRKSYEGINYSDGDKIEQHIAHVVSQASDRSVLSTELRAACTDWPTHYHLSPQRANLLRPLEPILKGRILEVGAGCGALTRYLGECGADILALEGSPRRAAIAAARTADLANVTVVSEHFQKFTSDECFDAILLIGVLEYANLFISSPVPALAMLEQVRSLLAPGGKLIIAIENQLGLKYFAGAPEDHIGQPMYGIEGRYRHNQPQTFGREKLTALVQQAGFPGTTFFVPLPDYKLPTSVITPAGLADTDFDAAALAWQTVRMDMQLPARPHFSLERTWPQVFTNGLGLDLANSFLVVATPYAELSFVDRKTLAYHYSTNRLAAFCKETRFVKTAPETMSVIYRRLIQTAASVVKQTDYQLTLPESSPYIRGVPLVKRLIDLISEPGEKVQQFTAFCKDYIDLLRQLLKESEDHEHAGVAYELKSIDEKIPGRYIDAIPQNLIVDAQGNCTYIDAEWCAEQSLELGYLLFRSMLYQIQGLFDFSLVHEQGISTPKHFIMQVLQQCDLPITEADFARYVALECEFQAFVTGVSDSELKDRWLKEPHQELPEPVSAPASVPGPVTSDFFSFERNDWKIFWQRTSQLIQQKGGISTALLRIWRIFKKEGVRGIKLRLVYLREQCKK